MCRLASVFGELARVWLGPDLVEKTDDIPLGDFPRLHLPDLRRRPRTGAACDAFTHWSAERDNQPVRRFTEPNDMAVSGSGSHHLWESVTYLALS